MLADGQGERPMPESRMLIVERKLIANRGHHHTQIAALATLLPDRDIALLVGADSDTTLSFPFRKIQPQAARDERMARRLAHGSLAQKLAAIGQCVVSGRLLSPPASGYGPDLAAAIRGFGLGRSGVVVIPSAGLDDLSAIADAARRVPAGTMPQIHARIIDPLIGEGKVRLREALMTRLCRAMPPRTVLYCETEEMAADFSVRYGYPFTGGFYLPCMIDPGLETARGASRASRPIRIGVFGAPRPEKGAARIGSIVAALRADGTSAEFVIQAEARAFASEGAYAGIETQAGTSVRISRMDGTLEPEAFRQLFLSVDAVLLPYDVSVYGLQGSGLVQDAVAAGIPILLSHGMSMRRITGRGNALEATSDAEFAEAIRRLARDPGACQSGCDQARATFRAILANHPLPQNVAAYAKP